MGTAALALIGSVSAEDCPALDVKYFSDVNCTAALEVNENVTQESLDALSKALGDAYTAQVASAGACTAVVEGSDPSYKFACTADSYTVSSFTDAECATAADPATQTEKFDKCIELAAGTTYMQLAGAKALMAGAAAALAMVASQF